MSAWDVPACFKRILMHPDIVHMFVYRVLTTKYGVEYFADKTNPFGYTPSEWEWQCVLAVLMWKFQRSEFEELLDYVDNFFDIMPAGTLMEIRCEASRSRLYLPRRAARCMRRRSTARCYVHARA